MLLAEYRNEKEDCRTDEENFQREPEYGFVQKDIFHRNHNEHGITGLFLFGLRGARIVEIFVEEL